MVPEVTTIDILCYICYIIKCALYIMHVYTELIFSYFLVYNVPATDITGWGIECCCTYYNCSIVTKHGGNTRLY